MYSLRRELIALDAVSISKDHRLRTNRLVEVLRWISSVELGKRNLSVLVVRVKGLRRFERVDRKLRFIQKLMIEAA